MLTILVLLLPFLLPDLDIDGDGFKAKQERAVGCDPFNRESFPVCGDLDGDGFGRTSGLTALCTLEAGFSLLGGDCHDGHHSGASNRQRTLKGGHSITA